MQFFNRYNDITQQKNSPLDWGCVVAALVENYRASKPLNVSPEKSQILNCGAVVLTLLSQVSDIGNTLRHQTATVPYDRWSLSHVTFQWKISLFTRILFCVDSEYSEVFATCSKHDIRVWNTETSLELLRISVPNFTCTGVQFSCDGKSIVSGKFCTGYCTMRVACYKADIAFISWRSKLSPVVWITWWEICTAP